MWKKYFPEFLGTFIIVFLGTGAIIVNQQWAEILGQTGISFAFGTGVFLAVYFFPSAQFNPAVSCALMFSKKMEKTEGIKNIVFQLLGAVTASGILKIIFPENASLGATLPSRSSSQSFILEIFLTFVLMYGALFISSKENKLLLAAVLGSIVFLEAYFGGPISGASMNPARSIAPAVISKNIGALWIYIFAPIIGAILAIVFWKWQIKKT